MSSAADEVIRAFVAAFSANDGHVALRQRGGHSIGLSSTMPLWHAGAAFVLLQRTSLDGTGR